MHIRKNDKVKILAGKDKGRTGQVREIIPGKDKVVVTGVNIVSKHSRPTQSKPGGIQKKEAPLHISNVALMCGKCGKATAVKTEKIKTGEKIRKCKKCGADIV